MKVLLSYIVTPDVLPRLRKTLEVQQKHFKAAWDIPDKVVLTNVHSLPGVDLPILCRDITVDGRFNHSKAKNILFEYAENQGYDWILDADADRVLTQFPTKLDEGGLSNIGLYPMEEKETVEDLLPRLGELPYGPGSFFAIHRDVFTRERACEEFRVTRYEDIDFIKNICNPHGVKQVHVGGRALHIWHPNDERMTDVRRSNQHLFYRRLEMQTDFLYAYWFNSCNFGDLLTPYLIEKLSRRRAVWAWPSAFLRVYFVTGSNITMDLSNSPVWGAGSINVAEKIKKKPLEIHAVRGPITRKQVRDSGWECPEVYGDPGLVLPRVYRPKSVEKKWKLGIIPHYVDMHRAWNRYGMDPKVRLINVTEPIERVIDDIVSCEKIVSSSLHGLIVADAYGVPTHQVAFGDSMAGVPHKFWDYWDGAGLPRQNPIDLRKHVAVESFMNAPKPRPIRTELVDKLLEVCPLPRA